MPRTSDTLAGRVQHQRVERLRTREDVHLDDAAAPWHVPRPGDVQRDVRSHRADEWREHTMHVERRGREVLKQPTRNPRSHRRGGEARHGQHAQRQHGGRACGTDIPLEAPARDVRSGDTIQYAAADLDALDRRAT